jgi:radical SAM superfamily enzyme YgiQ (UPF0313 family)
LIPNRFVDPVAEFGGLLLEVEKPGRYVGGEAGILAKRESAFRTLIAFPDLYEIGMGNQALRIIYNRLNSMKDISCDRAFAPAPDFERLLRENKSPLYGLDTGISLACLDLLMFTIGYELGLNGVLTMLDVSQIPLHCTERGEDHPVVIAGGPAVSNPLPYSPFIDAFWIGEAEAGFFDLVGELAQLKKKGRGRVAILDKISRHQNVWVRGKEKATRAIYSCFSYDDIDANVFPVPSMKIIHNHGIVEITRGCPNGCRFCHAGFWYRPMRQKSRERIISQVQEMITKGGWQQISLSSLSSGDYCGIGELIETLNRMFGDKHVSFQLPSLKVSSFSLSLLEKISVTRKSGLTFAVETPQDAWQMAINKEVTRDSVTAILKEAKKRGWKSAKFYFMIGLPLSLTEKSEEEEIVEFIVDIGKRTRMRFNINVGIFIPKPHTPYQWAYQIDSASSVKKMEFIVSMIRPMGHKVSIADPLISRIEGLLSRGDERAGYLCEEAFRGGSRLEAWDEYINRDKWQELINANESLIYGISFDKEHLPWDVINSCITPVYLKKELEKSNNSRRTGTCMEKCNTCGACGKNARIIKNTDNQIISRVNNNQRSSKSDSAVYRVLFGFSKKKSAVFHGHLSLIEIFSMSFRRADIPVLYTQGFNPHAKIEFASPLSTGISADFEIASVDFAVKLSIENFINDLNNNLPHGIRIEKADSFFIPAGIKKYSLSSLLWGFAYAGISNKIDYVNLAQEKVYRKSRLENDCHSLFSLKRKAVLARNKTGETVEWSSYFDAYRFFYPVS